METAKGTRLGAAAALLASSVLLSRVLGYAREALLAYRVGAGASTDAYYAAFQIPDLLNYLLAGGALSIAFIPLYARHLTRGDASGADRLFGVVLGTLGVVSIAATAVLWWMAGPLIALQFPRFSPETQALTVHLTRIVLPAQVFFVAGGIINATLLAQSRFGAAAAAPMLYNLGIIAGGLFLAPYMAVGVEGFAWGALAGAVAGPFLAPLLDARGRIRFRLRISMLDRTFLAYLAVAAPLMFGQTLVTVDEWYGRWFGALLGAGTVAHLGYARRLMLVPVAAVGQAIAAAALPTLARLWAEDRREELDQVVLRTLQAGIVLAVFGAGAFFVLSRGLVHLLYQHGRFSAADTVSVAAILSLLSLGIPAWIIQQIAVRSFYARGDTWRPMLLGTAVAAAAIPLYLFFAHRFGVLGLAAAGAIGMSANAIGTLLLARWLHRAPPLGALFGTMARTAVVAAAAATAVHFLVGGANPHDTSAALLDVLVGGAVYSAVVLVGVLAVGDTPMREALQRLQRLWRRSRPA